MALPELNSISQGNFLSTDPETIGFDLSSGSKWIYPENYPRRDYQFSIVQTALYSNTLVCLPTGLGKTFIAAVVMYNFWRWYPRGRVVFLAPTKPLVAQQIHACHEIMGIPSEETIELTGAVNQNKRAQAWAQKRVIFATPQTFQKDLQNNYVPYELIKCIVIDEAHKALGKHSYCEIVRMVSERNQFFRVLALSATPGSKIDHVREVIQNLLISDLELRDDTSPDITPYTNDRMMDRVIVRLDPVLQEYKERYICIMDPHVRILIKNNILQGDAANISKGRIFMLMKQYESRPQKSLNHGTIMKTLNILLTMYHAYELLIKHGLRAFYNFYLNHSDKFWLNSELDLKLLLHNIKLHIGDFPIIQASHNEEIPDIPDDLVFGHSKFMKLRELLVNHFRSYSEQNKSTRAIVFVEYRDIVNEIYVLLLQLRPLIRPQMFVGQAGQKQKLQLAALEDFRNNKVNVLISTSVGEEGLDVGEVDLIICFDISTSTPTRLVQRMGRTGRKRNGRVILLLTEGKEVQTLNQAMSKKDSLNNKVLQSSNITSSLYQSSPRLVPPNINPECLPMFIKSLPKTPKEVKTKKAKSVVDKTKEPAVKKPRKKKKDQVPVDDECMILTPADPKPSCSTQSSMMKFLTDNRQKTKHPVFNPCELDSGISEEFQIPNHLINSDNPYTFIRSDEVKLLTSDNHALEFLTLCAMKKSEGNQTNDYDYIKIDKTWIPDRSPVGNDFFEKFEIPALDCLDCIKHLTLYEKKDRENGNDEVVMDDFGCNKTPEIKNFENYQTNSMDVYNDEFTIIESKYVNENQEQKYELDANDFREDLIPNKSKYMNPQEEIKLKATDFQDDFEKSKSSFHSTPEPEPATIEVDFSSILDEYTESEASESPALIPDNAANIFDDLLDGGSSTDDDLFTDCNQTVISNDRTIIGKRNASQSPCQEICGSKKQKLSEDFSSDGEVFGTPQRKKENRLTLAAEEIQKKDVVYPDSDEDIFGDLEDDSFETQFIPDKPKEKSPSPEEQPYPTSPILSLPRKMRDESCTQNKSTHSTTDEDIAMFENIEEPAKEIQPKQNQPLDNQFIDGISEINWDDDVDFAPIVKKKSPEHVSSFFSKPSTSVTSGWINPSRQSQQALALKNFNIITDKKVDSDFKIPEIPKRNDNGDPKVMTARISRPLSLKFKANQPLMKPTISDHTNKENKFPHWKSSPKKSSSISPRFRKYHSENNICIEKQPKKRKKIRKRIANNFIDDEADVSSDVDTSDGSSDEDADLENFVSYTQDIPDEIDMRAHYLRTMNESPVKTSGFLFRQPRNKIPDIEIYSQPVTQYENSYMHDSFCVGDETEMIDQNSDSDEDSILDQAESSLESRRRKMRERREKKKLKFNCLLKNKKSCNIRKDSSSSGTNFSGSSEDETEALRRQVMEESMLMKK